MEGAIVRPSMKLVWLGYLFAALIAAIAIWAILTYATDAPRWVAALPLIVFLFPLRSHMRNRLITLRFLNDHLTLETGFLSRTRRTVDTAKIQDVTVRQSLGQRLIGTG